MTAGSYTNFEHQGKREPYNILFSMVVAGAVASYFRAMSDEHSESTPAWIETSALTAPALLGASAGLLLGDLMHRSARRGVGIGLGALGVALLLPYVFGGVKGLVTGPRSRVGVRRKIQRIRDAGIGVPDYDEVDQELRAQGLI
jgi:hypothetical protein